MGLPHETNWSEHKPPNVMNLWGFDIHTDRTSQANRPDIVVKNHNDEPYFLIDMSVPSDTNVSLRISEKLSKYKDLEIEVIEMWLLKTAALPVIICALVMMAKTAPNYVLQIPAVLSLTKLENKLMGTAFI